MVHGSFYSNPSTWALDSSFVTFKDMLQQLSPLYSSISNFPLYCIIAISTQACWYHKENLFWPDPLPLLPHFSALLCINTSHGLQTTTSLYFLNTLSLGFPLYIPQRLLLSGSPVATMLCCCIEWALLVFIDLTYRLHLAQSITLFIWNLVTSRPSGLHALLIFLLSVEIHSPSLTAESSSPTRPWTSAYRGLATSVYIPLSMIILNTLALKIPSIYVPWICLFSLDLFLELWVCTSSCLFHTLLRYQ